MKKGFFLSFVLMILFFTSIFIAIAIRLSYQYVSSVTYYQRLIFYHYMSKSILKMWHDNRYDGVLKSWVIIDNKKICYVRIANNKIYLMDDEEPKGKIIYYYEEN
jgi:hypothetical protein